MRISIAVPGEAGTLTGNWRTAERWRGLLGDLGHDVTLGEPDAGTQLLIALHALRSHGVILSARRRFPRIPIIVTLTGTDLYRDLREDPRTRESLDHADRIVVLQRLALEELPDSLRARAHVIYQSAPPWERKRDPGDGRFRIAVVANLRPVKDALLPARAARLLPEESRVRVTLVGSAPTSEAETEARREGGENPRFLWRGFLPHDATRDEIAASDLVVIPSRIEGSSNVLSESLVTGVPVIASKISGLMGTLGEGYEGYFPVGDARALADLMRRAEIDPRFLTRLAEQCERVRPLVAVESERAAWAALIAVFRHKTPPGGDTP